MADGHVAVRRQHHQEEGAGDLIDGGGDEVDLAEAVPEGPLSHVHGDNEERDSHQETLVGHSQVEDVGVGHCVHLGEPAVHTVRREVEGGTGDSYLSTT